MLRCFHFSCHVENTLHLCDLLFANCINNSAAWACFNCQSLRTFSVNLANYQGVVFYDNQQLFHEWALYMRWQIANEARSAEWAIIISYLTSVSGIIVLLRMLTKYWEFFPTLFVKTSDFQLVFLFWADVYSYHICKAWYSGSYTMMAKPITALELHYPMIHFLIILTSWKIMGRESDAFDIYRESYIFEMLLFRNSSHKFKRIQWIFKVKCIFKSFILHDIWYGSHSFIHRLFCKAG